ncbi:lasso peptide biosynthesis B2 protein [Streptomyces sp. WG7]|uniref:lasso peptide biosynthesis B2 protein n=1 Tax=Streptomyces sp. WG7 TaxID=3417650 RepID=UPI003CFA8793
MSVRMTMPDGAAGGPWQRVRTRAVVLVALVLARLSPRRLRSVLRRAAAGARPAGYTEAESHYHAVAAASPHCAGWQGCLPRSIAVCLLCRTEGTWPAWCTGVRVTLPFTAHAWLEADGRIVAEPGTPGAYRALMRVEAGLGG